MNLTFKIWLEFDSKVKDSKWNHQNPFPYYSLNINNVKSVNFLAVSCGNSFSAELIRPVRRVSTHKGQSCQSYGLQSAVGVSGIFGPTLKSFLLESRVLNVELSCTWSKDCTQTFVSSALGRWIMLKHKFAKTHVTQNVFRQWYLHGLLLFSNPVSEL